MMLFHDKFPIKYIFHFYNYENTYMYKIVNKESSEKHVFCKTISHPLFFLKSIICRIDVYETFPANFSLNVFYLYN